MSITLRFRRNNNNRHIIQPPGPSTSTESDNADDQTNGRIVPNGSFNLSWRVISTAVVVVVVVLVLVSCQNLHVHIYPQRSISLCTHFVGHGNRNRMWISPNTPITIHDAATCIIMSLIDQSRPHPLTCVSFSSIIFYRGS